MGATALNDFVNTQCRVAVGGSVTGDLTTRNEGDSLRGQIWWQGETYRIDLEGADTSQGTNTDPSLRGI